MRANASIAGNVCEPAPWMWRSTGKPASGKTERNAYSAMSARRCVPQRRCIEMWDIFSPIERKVLKCFLSICYNEKYIGFVFKSESILNQYILNVYNLNGKKVLDKTMDFQYSDLQMKDNLLIFNNTQQMYIISVDGILKYNGTIQEGIQKVIPGKLENRYMIITNQEAEEIKLK